ncbi:MAG TPA: hypothetical protein VEB63_11225, partial [Chitinophagaceae bacterium]|nr:hypothetical protein [Chitinophagaceae bacterium]
MAFLTGCCSPSEPLHFGLTFYSMPAGFSGIRFEIFFSFKFYQTLKNKHHENNLYFPVFAGAR